MQYIDVIRVLNKQCGQALRAYLAATGETGIVIYSHRRLGTVVVLEDGVIYPLDLDALAPADGWKEINLTEQNVAWYGGAVHMGKLPNGSVVWTDGDRFKKVGGTWCRLQSRYYICVSEANTMRFCPQAWLR